MSLAGTEQSCNTSTLVGFLADRGLTAYGQADPTDMTDRNRDRVRILRYIAHHPEGVKQTVLTHEAVKGVEDDTYLGYYDLSADGAAGGVWSSTGEWVALDGSDPDYQFANRFVTDLEAETDLIRTENASADETRGRFVFPTPSLLDLISEGTTETPACSDTLVYDREFCRNLLESKRSDLKRLSDSEKDHLANSLRRYIQRVRDYRLAFDVHLANRNGYDCRRMEKPFKTRFSDEGRVDKTFAMLQDSLEWGAERADTAVFCTLTTDPKKFDTLLDAILSINENFHALNQWMKSDPSTKDDTRKEAVPAWKGPDCGVTGRPREKLEYVKVLEFTEAGYPHLHVLYFDPPRRETDGMPWLCDKAELSHQWNKDTEKRTGQGTIVDAWPLVYRDDLEDVDAEFNADDGFVSWYRYGDHDHDQEWIDARSNEHDQIDFDGAEENPYEKTAGSYIGKYLAETYALLQNTEALDDPDFDPESNGKSSWWKLALYWVTNRRFWSPSRTIRRDIKLDDDRSDIRRGVADATVTSLEYHTERCHEPHALYPDPDADRRRSYLAHLTRDLVAEADVAAQEAAASETTLARVEYLGAYHVDDMPRSGPQRMDVEPFEDACNTEQSGVTLASTGDRPPPAADAW